MPAVDSRKDRICVMADGKLAHYRIVEKLGEGGMGVVYKAHDTHLDRFVALKVLPAERVADPERRRRFVQEAKSASALNHPNVIHIYDIDNYDGTDFIAMEYVPGNTLDQLIRRKGLFIDEVLWYAMQITDALAATHAAGIVHRDLKPGNVMVTDTGTVKVLDFGLAKLSEPAEIDELASTRTMQAQTEAGTIVGTVAYMSPEQAEGKKVDARSDIFSFGSVLYEMVTGQRAFSGDGRISVLAAILHREPIPVNQVAAGIPPELERIIRKALEKDRNLRYQTSLDLRSDLARLVRESDRTVASSRRRRLPISIVVGVLLMILIILGYQVWRSRRGTAIFAYSQLTDQPGPERFPSLSPDGKSLVYAARGDIYLQRVAGKNPINLTRNSEADNTQPALSPDGDLIAFRSDRGGGGIFIMGATGESVKRLTDFGFTPAWSPDGKEIVFATLSMSQGNPSFRPVPGSRLWKVTVATGEKRPVTSLESVPDAVQPHWSPHGYRIAYWTAQGGQRDIWTVSADGTRPAPVTQDGYVDWSPVWSPDGRYLYFASDRSGSMNLWRAPMDEKSGRVLGALEPVTTPSPYSGPLSIARDGRRIAYVQQVSNSNVQKVELDPFREAIVGQPRPVTQGSKYVWGLDLSADGEWLTFSTMGQEDIFVLKTDGSEFRQLTDDLHKDRFPRWSPDGKRIAFYSNRSGRMEFWTINPESGGLRQLTWSSDPGLIDPVWSPDGKRLVCSRPLNGSPFLIEMDKPWKEQSLQELPPLDASNPPLNFWSWSRDGRKLAGHLTQGTLTSGVVVYALDSQRYTRLTSFGKCPVWLNDSRRLVFLAGDKLYLVDSDSRRTHELLSVAPYSLREGLSISRDDRLIYFALATVEADIWLATLQ